MMSFKKVYPTDTGILKAIGIYSIVKIEVFLGSRWGIPRKVNSRWTRFRGIWIGIGATVLALVISVVAIRRAPLKERKMPYDFGAIPKSGQGLSETHHKSDKDLIDNFRAHRSEFDRLLRMVMEDKSLYRVDYNWTEP